MSGWTEIENGDIKIKHHSTSSLIEMIITKHEEIEQGKFVKFKQKVWFDYKTFSDLRKVMNKADLP